MLLAMTLTVSTSTVAGAKSGVADAAKEARDAFANGEQAFAADDYELALHHFRTAMELAPHDAVRFNLAVCFERLGRFREAVEEYAAAARSPQLDRAQACASGADQPRTARHLLRGSGGRQAIVDGAFKCVILSASRGSEGP